MMYRDKFVVAVKCDGRILREKDGVAYLPFGSEYSLLLKNLESRKSSVKISIDGIDVMNGRSLLISPNSSIDLERFVESLNRGNRFKFIQKTKEIVEHRGDRIDDGIVRVEFAFEQVTKHINIIEHHDHYSHYYYPHWYHPYWCPPYHWPHQDWKISSGNAEWTYCSNQEGSAKDMSASGYAKSFACASAPTQDEGITVRGSESRQNFHEGYIGVLDPSEVIIIRLRGEAVAGVNIKRPITVKDRVQCDTCGNAISPIVDFCEKCGTAIGIR